MAKKVDRKALERRREAVRRLMAQGMKQSEIAEALAKEGFFPEGQVNVRLVERDIRAIRREEARTTDADRLKKAKDEYIQKLEEIIKMAESGKKPDLRVALAAVQSIADARGVRPDDVKLTPEKVSQMPKWVSLLQRCGHEEIKAALRLVDKKGQGKK